MQSRMLGLRTQGPRGYGLNKGRSTERLLSVQGLLLWLKGARKGQAEDG